MLISKLRERFSLLRHREEGQTMAEYGVVLAVITIACVIAFGLLSNAIQTAIDMVVNVLPAP